MNIRLRDRRHECLVDGLEDRQVPIEARDLERAVGLEAGRRE